MDITILALAAIFAVGFSIYTTTQSVRRKTKEEVMPEIETAFNLVEKAVVENYGTSAQIFNKDGTPALDKNGDSRFVKRLPSIMESSVGNFKSTLVKILNKR